MKRKSLFRYAAGLLPAAAPVRVAAIPVRATVLPGILATALVVILAAVLAAGCSHRKSDFSSAIRSLSPEGIEATDPYMTRDHRGRPVLCWTEKTAAGPYILKYAVFDSVAGTFGTAVSVPPSRGTRTSAESANKLAWKADGSIVAVFGRRFEDPRNRFAGAVMYSLSKDDGKNWSVPRYLHSDTLHQYGRGFFDLAVLPGGEVGAVWLDGRYGEAVEGSALFFARTSKGEGFGPDRLIAQGTCECCRTDLLTDTSGALHLAYRSILHPPEHFGRQVRDMVYSVSVDTGRSFSTPLRISEDNWEIEGCPHAGPSLAAGREGLRAVWFTAGGSPGIYEAFSAGPGQAFGPRKLLSAGGRHPQSVALPGGGTALVWEEAPAEPAGEGVSGKGSSREKLPPHSGHGAGASHQLHQSHHLHPSGGPSAHPESSLPPTAIVLKVFAGEPAAEGKTGIAWLTGGETPAHHPVLGSCGPSRLVVAWVAEQNGVPGIRYRVVEL